MPETVAINAYLAKIDEAIQDAQIHFDNICADSTDIVIFMPSHFNGQFSEYLMEEQPELGSVRYNGQKLVTHRGM